jgi:hypothetical protein
MHWLGPYVINFVTDASVVQLDKLNGEVVKGFFNGSRLKQYRNICTYVH